MAWKFYYFTHILKDESWDINKYNDKLRKCNDRLRKFTETSSSLKITGTKIWNMSPGIFRKLKYVKFRRRFSIVTYPSGPTESYDNEKYYYLWVHKQCAKHTPSRGIWGHSPTGKFWKISAISSGGYRGIAIVSAETSSERARAPNQRRLVSRRAKITLKYG